ncbi:hypothetical protein CVT25_007615 [Psilocybe cyanescens]|uniref:Uncharacterized protein n=1 Tax=Psilocybe cyanescens TaxID=93625 RepID=A0A409X1C9_PSICY|nr:hypothetical protein CVT25_007615 [Psilocybe cyanescens]
MASLPLSEAYQVLLTTMNSSEGSKVVSVQKHLNNFHCAMLAALELENPELAPDEAGYITLKAQLQKVGVPSRLLSRLDEAREALKQAAMESIDVDSWDSFQFSEVLYKVKAKDKKVDEASEVSQRTVREGKKAKAEMLKSDLVDMGTSKCLACTSSGHPCLLLRDLFNLTNVSDVDELRKVLKGNRKVKCEHCKSGQVTCSLSVRTDKILNPPQIGVSKRKAESEASLSKTESRNVRSRSSQNDLEAVPSLKLGLIYNTASTISGSSLGPLKAHIEAIDVDDQDSEPSNSMFKVNTRLSKALQLFGIAQDMSGSLRAQKAGLGARIESLGATMMSLQEAILSISKDFAALENKERVIDAKFEEAKKLLTAIIMDK